MKIGPWFIKHALVYKKGFIFGGMLILTESILFLMMANTQKYIIDDVLGKGLFENFLWLLLVFFILYILNNIIHLFSVHVIRISSYKLNLTLLEELLNYISKTPLRTLQKQRTTDYVNYLASDLNKLNFTLSFHLSKGFTFFINILLVGVMIYFISPVILWGVITITIIYVFLGRFFIKKIFKTSKIVQESKAKYVSAIDEGVSSTREVLIFDRIAWESQRINHLFDNYMTEVRKESRILNIKSLVCDPLQWLTTLLVLGVGAFQVLKGEMSIGTYIVLYQFAIQMTQALKGTFDFILDMPTTLSVPLHRISTIINNSKVDDDKDKGLTPVVIESIAFSNISTKRSDSHEMILRDLNLSIPIGKMSMVLGKSGSGKSSMIELFVDSTHMIAGDILINQHSIKEIDRIYLTRKVAILQQEPYFFPDSIRNNLLLGRSESDETLLKISEWMDIKDFILELPDKLDTNIGERGVSFSGGQKQKLALVRSLIGSPEVLILDEATSAIDIESENSILTNLRKYRKGLTTIVISHRLDSAKLVDHLIVMDKGAIVEEGAADLLDQMEGHYSRLVTLQNQ
ncbi:ABC transporter ATP-binding protein [Paenibacillus sp. Dod16]|uniref:ABC transporter ATP-binding protein n=1 Tax=Paenibacillus sp. Dod16 TaxID=3416392 RepID=UPI003CF6ABBB